MSTHRCRECGFITTFDDLCGSCLVNRDTQRRTASNAPTPLIKEADPELERLLAEEDEIERWSRLDQLETFLNSSCVVRLEVVKEMLDNLESCPHRKGLFCGSCERSVSVAALTIESMLAELADPTTAVTGLQAIARELEGRK